MQALTIKPVSRPASPGDFGASIQDADLLLPDVLARTLASRGIRTAAELLSYLHAFPSAAAADLHWPVPAVIRGRESLRQLLRGHLDESILNPSPRPQRVHGARDPALLPKSRGR